MFFLFTLSLLHSTSVFSFLDDQHFCIADAVVRRLFIPSIVIQRSPAAQLTRISTRFVSFPPGCGYLLKMTDGKFEASSC